VLDPICWFRRHIFTMGDRL